jgi:hypothetical protein
VAGARNSIFRFLSLSALSILAGCATGPQDATLVGRHHCESFFIYSVCVADRDEDHSVDYMYFGDDLQIFMYDETTRENLVGIQPFHECAIPMSDSTRRLSSQLLYGDDLGLSERLSLKGKLIRNYRAAQPAVHACNARAGEAPGPFPADDDPFLIDEGWDEVPVDDWDDELPPRNGAVTADSRN